MGSPSDNIRTNWGFPFDLVHLTLHEHFTFLKNTTDALLNNAIQVHEIWAALNILLESFPPDNLLQEALSSIKLHTVIYILQWTTLFLSPAVFHRVFGLRLGWPFMIASSAQSQSKDLMAMRHTSSARAVQRPCLGGRTLPTAQTWASGLFSFVWPSFKVDELTQQNSPLPRSSSAASFELRRKIIMWTCQGQVISLHWLTAHTHFLNWY